MACVSSQCAPFRGTAIHTVIPFVVVEGGAVVSRGDRCRQHGADATYPERPRPCASRVLLVPFLCRGDPRRLQLLHHDDGSKRNGLVGKLHATLGGVVETGDNAPWSMSHGQIQTNLGREYTFGPYVPDDQHHLYTFHRVSQGVPKGLFYNDQSTHDFGRIIGFSTDLAASELETPKWSKNLLPAPTVVSLYRYYSEASLAGAATMSISWELDNHRPIGALITYTNGITAVLGQWYKNTIKPTEYAITSGNGLAWVDNATMPIDLKIAEVIFNTKPSVAHYSPIGCRAYVYRRDIKAADKTESRDHIGYLVGYDSSNIFCVWIPTLDQVIRARDVIFKWQFTYKDDALTDNNREKITEQEGETLDLKQLLFTATADDLYTTEQFDRHLEEIKNSTIHALRPNTRPNIEKDQRPMDSTRGTMSS
jgi:hypothetical protein